VYKAEHIDSKNLMAVKIIEIDGDSDELTNEIAILKVHYLLCIIMLHSN